MSCWRDAGELLASIGVHSCAGRDPTFCRVESGRSHGVLRPPGAPAAPPALAADHGTDGEQGRDEQRAACQMGWFPCGEGRQAFLIAADEGGAVVRLPCMF